MHLRLAPMARQQRARSGQTRLDERAHQPHAVLHLNLARPHLVRPGGARERRQARRRQKKEVDDVVDV